eukprot:XP_028343920.1 uncharacterized protein LOC114486036 [Physeter catodon]
MTKVGSETEWGEREVARTSVTSLGQPQDVPGPGLAPVGPDSVLGNSVASRPAEPRRPRSSRLVSRGPRIGSFLHFLRDSRLSAPEAAPAKDGFRRSAAQSRGIGCGKGCRCQPALGSSQRGTGHGRGLENRALRLLPAPRRPHPVYLRLGAPEVPSYDAKLIFPALSNLTPGRWAALPPSSAVTGGRPTQTTPLGIPTSPLRDHAPPRPRPSAPAALLELRKNQALGNESERKSRSKQSSAQQGNNFLRKRHTKRDDATSTPGNFSGSTQFAEFLLHPHHVPPRPPTPLTYQRSQHCLDNAPFSEDWVPDPQGPSSQLRDASTSQAVPPSLRSVCQLRASRVSFCFHHSDHINSPSSRVVAASCSCSLCDTLKLSFYSMFTYLTAQVSWLWDKQRHVMVSDSKHPL